MKKFRKIVLNSDNSTALVTLTGQKPKQNGRTWKVTLRGDRVPYFATLMLEIMPYRDASKITDYFTDVAWESGKHSNSYSCTIKDLSAFPQLRHKKNAFGTLNIDMVAVSHNDI